MKLKYCAEGWPPSVTNPALSEEEREAAKQRYIDEAREQFNIVFTEAEVIKNPGLKCG